MKPNDEHHYEFDPDNEEPYWEPSSREDELKMQIQMLRMDEITAERLRLLWISNVLNNIEEKNTLSLSFGRVCEELGSGQFGVVNRGVWSVGDEEREVAVKSLADDSTEDKRIQFLQEAAIMGQFKHPNVITLHGVLTENDPVSKVLTKCNFVLKMFGYTDFVCGGNNAQRRSSKSLALHQTIVSVCVVYRIYH